MDEASKAYFKILLAKYRVGEASGEEIKFLEAYYNLFDLTEDLITEENEPGYLPLKEAMKANIDEEIARYGKKPVPISSKRSWAKYAMAASILLFISVGAIYFFRNGHKPGNIIANNYNGIKPGGNKATLTLGNGKTIVLDNTNSGQIAQQAGVLISKTGNGEIVYQAAQSSGDVLQNTISTPKGGQYKVILPDGTNVWLNAASSLTYPTVFKGAERLVTLTGEGYFEVAKNKAIPFRVRSSGQTVEVLGTHFNINAYADEAAVKTTLLEGSVKVSSQAGTAVIVPGQQAQLSSNGVHLQEVDTEKEVAWKNGVFSFADEDLRTVMRQISRWYDIDVVYAGKIPDEKFFGEISRSSNLNEIFKILELNNIRFEVDGKTVKVSCSK
ncbi:FecR family protein [Mucilaginibacter oryzae]|uniref:FecR family protein n=1 Tax=Mucilaginibacter oryzae TaxID=468058 RepID=A0A316HZJ7_9SPHI|nr:FecR family protein [Mucilaginibacter oryzae]PWK80492.1 FecR family protein [Mucilaginibacter oryzae]